MSIIAGLTHEYQKHKGQAEKAAQPLADDAFFRKIDAQANSIAIIMKHLAGNFRSRWTDFLTSDGEKPDRNRDAEFVLTAADTRASLQTRWDEAWRIFFATIGELSDADLERRVSIRGEPHSVFQALLRGATHLAYHVGQILYLSRLLRPDSPWLTVAPGRSSGHPGNYLKPM